MRSNARVLGKAVTKMRQDFGLSTEELAEQSGVPLSLLARIETGAARGDEWGLQEICKLGSAMRITPHRVIAQWEQFIEEAGNAWPSLK